MNDLWLKIKLWTKVTVTAIAAIFFLVFLLKNQDKPIQVWLWNTYDTTVLRLIFYVFLAGVLVTVLTQTTIKTLYQFRTLRARAATARAEQQLAEMKSKAAMIPPSSSSDASSPAAPKSPSP